MIVDRIRRVVGQWAANIQTDRFLRQNLPPRVAFPDRWVLLEAALVRALVSVPNGLICEFGVWRGRTISYLANRLITWKSSAVVYGFDSFQGLPHDWRPGFPRGRYALDGPPDVPSNARLVSGLFHQTVPEFVQDHQESRAGFLHLDCDLYSSTGDVLYALRLNIGEGTVIVFDEFFRYPGWRRGGEYRAFMEFMDRHPLLSFRYLGYVHRGEQVAVQITKDRR